MFKVLLFPFRTVILFFKLAGVKGGLLFLIGIAVGLLVAPQTGPELRPDPGEARRRPGRPSRRRGLHALTRSRPDQARPRARAVGAVR
ncbi:hypothetical protein ACE2AJ_03480 [Aquihabitans daechungensis]|uniref:hypothetical protein n=1 Tax=Aquihabitans daechungensis TaxID=1052257 RepID=UPI003B9DFBD4